MYPHIHKLVIARSLIKRTNIIVAILLFGSFSGQSKNIEISKTTRILRERESKFTFRREYTFANFPNYFFRAQVIVLTTSTQSPAPVRYISALHAARYVSRQREHVNSWHSRQFSCELRRNERFSRLDCPFHATIKSIRLNEDNRRVRSILLDGRKGMPLSSIFIR